MVTMSFITFIAMCFGYTPEEDRSEPSRRRPASRRKHSTKEKSDYFPSYNPGPSFFVGSNSDSSTLSGVWERPIYGFFETSLSNSPPYDIVSGICYSKSPDDNDSRWKKVGSQCNNAESRLRRRTRKEKPTKIPGRRYKASISGNAPPNPSSKNCSFLSRDSHVSKKPSCGFYGICRSRCDPDDKCSGISPYRNPDDDEANRYLRQRDDDAIRYLPQGPSGEAAIRYLRQRRSNNAEAAKIYFNILAEHCSPTGRRM